MPWVIDGDNLLGSWPGRRRSRAERRSLAFQLDRFAAQRRRRVVVVFDGPAADSPGLGRDVIFAGPARSADEVILSLLREARDPRGWTVVTSDRSLGDQCRYLGARVDRSARFRKRLTSEVEPEKPRGEIDVDYWLEQFGEDGETD